MRTNHSTESHEMETDFTRTDWTTHAGSAQSPTCLATILAQQVDMKTLCRMDRQKQSPCTRVVNCVLALDGGSLRIGHQVLGRIPRVTTCHLDKCCSCCAVD